MSEHRSAPEAQALHVFYDGGCPVCRREIAHYRRLRPRRRVAWVDIHADPEASARFGISQRAAMARFHIADGSRVHTGADAFLHLWAAMPGWRHLAAAIRRLRLERPLEWAYARFAERRLERRCDDARCRL